MFHVFYSVILTVYENLHQFVKFRCIFVKENRFDTENEDKLIHFIVLVFIFGSFWGANSFPELTVTS